MAYLLTLLTGLLAQGFVSERLVVGGDAAATAHNILGHPGLFQLGFSAYLVEMACNVAMTALFYVLLTPAGKAMSLVAAYLGLVGCVVKTFSRVFYIAPVFLLGGSHGFGAFTQEQLQALALMFLRVNEQGAGIGLAFFGFSGILKGYLIFRSTFLPRFLGVWSVVASFGWLSFVSPSLGYRLFPVVAVFGLLGAIAQIFWLIVYGVNEERWKARARANWAVV